MNYVESFIPISSLQCFLSGAVDPSDTSLHLYIDAIMTAVDGVVGGNPQCNCRSFRGLAVMRQPHSLDLTDMRIKLSSARY